LVFKFGTSVKKYILFFFFLISVAHAQIDMNQLVERPAVVFKFAPRIFAPRFAVERVLSEQSSWGVELRLYTWWLPQAGRTEFFYRRYINGMAPFGAYIQPKVALGYFDYAIIDAKTNGLHLGGGLSFGKQMRMGRRKGTFDIFTGIQLVAPLYFNIEYSFNHFGSKQEYQLLHYILVAFPLEVGFRFGFFSTERVPGNYQYNQQLFNPQF
jgi:hypothetical protein